MNRPKSFGISIRGASGSLITGNQISGFDVGIDADGGRDNIIEANHVVAAEAVELFAKLDAEIVRANLDEAIKARVLSELASLRAAVGTPSYLDRYKEFMAVCADHLQVFGPVAVSLIPQLAIFL